MELKVCGIFLEISKAFVKAWHDGLIFKLRQNDSCGEIINILKELLNDRKQRVVLNGQCSSWADIHAGVPQGFGFGFKDNLSNNIKSKRQLFDNDTSLFSVVHDIDIVTNELEKSSLTQILPNRLKK